MASSTRDKNGKTMATQQHMPVDIDDDELNTQEIKWLTELGLIAPQLGHTKTALTIFRALLLCRPEEAFSYLGIAFTYLGVGKNKEAIALLEKTLSQHPDNHEVKCILAFALKMEHRNAEANRLLEGVIATQGNSAEPVFQLAENLLKPDSVIPPQKPRRLI